jgi:uncharacterized protein (DUF885 family)
VSTAAALADELFSLYLDREPLSATLWGLPGHDAEVPSITADADAAYAAALGALRARAESVDSAGQSASERITLAAVLNTIDQELIGVAVAAIEFTASPMPIVDGPALLLMLASSTKVSTPQQARDLATRTAAYGGYLDRCTERLRAGAAAGRHPLGSLAAKAVAQVDGYLGGDGPDVFSDVAPPDDWDGAAAWQRELAAAVDGSLRPALRRWRDAVQELPGRADDECGLLHLPGGAAAYDQLVALHTTLPLTAREVHEIGLTAVAELVEDAVQLGGSLGLTGFPAVRDALRASLIDVDAEQAMAAASRAIARAERVSAGVFPPPPPPPCVVAPMSEHVGRSGVSPHYTRPAADGSRPGTYWFNATEPATGAGWDLEVTAFHEGVPGHHLQAARMAAAEDLPALQRYFMVTAHAEGWGLYAEVLAGELGLYSSTEARIGAVAASLLRAARLVVDTGIHALGWTRSEALTYLVETVPMAEHALSAEVDRYIAMPGQALSYFIGRRELLRLRAAAQERLGDRFDLAGFHSAVLDQGDLPLPALAVAVDSWVGSTLL